MSLRFTLAMVRREGRSTRRRLSLYMVAVTLGVAALVAINSFRVNVTETVRSQARGLLGADLVLGSRWEFPRQVEALLDSLQREGVRISRQTSFSSMALSTRSGLTRLVQVRAPEGDYPFYGELKTDPPDLWQAFRSGHQALVDAAVLVQLDAKVGDTLAIGHGRFVIAGSVLSFPGDIGLRSAIGPRVYIPSQYLTETGLLRFGSISYYRAYLQTDHPVVVERLVEAQDSLLEASRVRYTTVEEYEEELTSGLDRLGSFLSLVGLVALLLGGIGVASGVHVFVSEKLDTAAVLRCLGATQRQAFAIYLTQAGLMGLGGAALGAALGLGVQAAFPRVVADFLPLDVPFSPEPAAILAGLGIGLWVSLIFALLPLLRIRDVAPLRALRRDYERPRRRRDFKRLGVLTLLLASVLAMAFWQAPEPVVGLAFGGAVAVTTAALALTAAALMRAMRRFFPRRARFPLRQGIANLFRPHNQTVTVTLAIGFGVFLIATLYVVQRNLLDQIVMETRPDRPNLLLFDIQRDQSEAVATLLAERGAPVLQRTPVVPARLTRLADRTVEEVLADSTGARVPRWALLREYRHTYRDTLVGSERLIAGDGFAAERVPAAAGAERPSAISIEESVAEELGVWVGDRIGWDIQGVPLETEITSVRRVDWARFEPNFFVVFEPGSLEQAPQSLVMLSRIDDPIGRAEVQRDLVLSFPNVAAIDLTIILDAIDAVLSKVAVAIRFMALFSIGSGLVILIGAIATSRYQRVRESITLKTLGARSKTIRRILATEYFALGSFAGLAGVGLAAIAGWLAVTLLFELRFDLPVTPLVGLWVGTALLTTLIGLANSREVLRRTPLAGMRELAE